MLILSIYETILLYNILSILVDIMAELYKNLATSAGLTDKEAQIYLALLNLGEASVIDVAKFAGLKRTTVYNILPDLMMRGLISAAGRAHKRKFFVEDVRHLKMQAEDREKKINRLLPELQAMHNILPSKARITYYEGEGGMRALYRDTLDSQKPGDTMYAFTGMINMWSVMPKDFVDDYIKERVNKKIRIKVIAPKSLEADEWVKTAAATLREIKLINNSTQVFSSDMEIYDNKVALISYKENFVGVIIESKEICQMMRAAFQVMWEGL